MNLDEKWDLFRGYGDMPESRPTWKRIPGANGGTCGSAHVHESGWSVRHCGHPTANYPYYVQDGEGLMHLDPITGRGLTKLVDAKHYILKETRSE